MSEPLYVKKTADDVECERSTCGFRRRLLKKDEGVPASITHLKTFDAKPHWHQCTHEYYYVLQGEGCIVIDEVPVPVVAGDVVWIKPGAMHHAEGELESLIVGVPAYDPNDTFFEK